MSAINVSTQKIGSSDITVLTFDLPGEKVNKLSTPVMTELKGHLEKIKNSGQINELMQSLK